MKSHGDVLSALEIFYENAQYKFTLYLLLLTYPKSTKLKIHRIYVIVLIYLLVYKISSKFNDISLKCSNSATAMLKKVVVRYLVLPNSENIPTLF